MNEAWAVIKTNRMILRMNIIICSTLTGGYILDVIKGRKTIAIVALFLAIIAIDLGMSLIAYGKDKASASYKYISIIGYTLIYCYAMFSSATYFTFVFIYPMSVLYVLYFNTKLIKYIGAGTIVLNIAKIIYQIYYGHSGSDDITSYTVQIALAVLVSVGQYVVTDLTLKLNEEKVAKLLEANQMVASVESLYENIDEQLNKSEDIVHITDEIKTLSENMTVISNNLTSTLNTGMETVKELNHENEKVNKSSGIVYDDIKTLNKLSNDITKKVKDISNVALNTHILALNAAVEAVRAGEHNKGFMVVAEEVGKLAEQSKTSANQISNIIGALSEKTSETLKEVDYLIENNASQNSAIKSVKSAFLSVETEIDSMTGKIVTLDNELKNLAASNRDINTSTKRIADLAAGSQSFVVNV